MNSRAHLAQAAAAARGLAEALGALAKDAPGLGRRRQYLRLDAPPTPHLASPLR